MPKPNRKRATPARRPTCCAGARSRWANIHWLDHPAHRPGWYMLSPGHALVARQKHLALTFFEVVACPYCGERLGPPVAGPEPVGEEHVLTPMRLRRFPMTRPIADVLADASLDREAADLAEGAPWSHSDVFVEDADGETVAITEGGKYRALNNAVHIARNDPARVLQRAEDVEALAARVEELERGRENGGSR